MDLRDLCIGLLWIALPLWLLAGFGDWLSHRRTRIQQTSGTPEPALHVALYLLIAVPVVLALYFEVSALLLAIMALGVLLHMVISLLDTRYAQPRRFIAPLEQQIHSWLEMLPLFALALVAVLHWDAVLRPAWHLLLRPQPLPGTAAILAGLAVGQLLILEELFRCLRAARHA